MHAYIAYSPASDTSEIASCRRGVPIAEQATAPIGSPWATPPVTSVYAMPRLRMARRVRQLGRAARRDVTASAHAAFGSAVIGSGLVAGLALVSMGAHL